MFLTCIFFLYDIIEVNMSLEHNLIEKSIFSKRKEFKEPYYTLL
jgi:hypothetical protein